MQIPLHLYLLEIKIRLWYFFFSCFSCFVIILNYHEAILFFYTYSFSFINKGKFITTHIAELFATYMYISFNVIAFANFPYAYYHCNQFLGSSWYKSQIWFFKNIQIHSSLSFFVSLFACYFIVLPYAYMFLDTWTITIIHAYQIQLEARIETYTWWTLQTSCLLSNSIYLFFTRIIYFFLMDNMINLHIFYRKNKKYTLFLICLATSICLPPETVIQILFIFIVVLLSEIFFLVTCLFFAKNNV
uniref:SecY-independent transporter protein n=1 Tax=Pyropia dentata TaxID=76160 RepID=A0A8J9WSQ0_PYRDN|nr:SecY-independent protein translocase component tatC [Neoporphyra dentata]WKD83573.1 SecY-independent protein translocase component tatC [Neoporphyra dentata]BDB33250.1 SecY-independent transporter protein [Neoporphyra dentata]